MVSDLAMVTTSVSRLMSSAFAGAGTTIVPAVTMSKHMPIVVRVLRYISRNHSTATVNKLTTTKPRYASNMVVPSSNKYSAAAFVIAYMSGRYMDVAQVVANLCAKYRVPLVLAYFNQFSYDEIAEQLNISRNHVGVLLLRAKQRLRADLVTEGGEGVQ